MLLRLEGWVLQNYGFVIYGCPRGWRIIFWVSSDALSDPFWPPNCMAWDICFLGFNIYSRLMRVSWPTDKREKLANFLRELLADQSAGRPSTPVHQSRPWSDSPCCPCLPTGGVPFLCLQHFFNDCVSSVTPRSSTVVCTSLHHASTTHDL
jgi:hypothetical protein